MNVKVTTYMDRAYMKGKFDDYVLWPLAKKIKNWIVDQSAARDLTVLKFDIKEAKNLRITLLKSSLFEVGCIFATIISEDENSWKPCAPRSATPRWTVHTTCFCGYAPLPRGQQDICGAAALR